MRYCEELDTHEFAALVKYAISEHEDWLNVIVNKVYFFPVFLMVLGIQPVDEKPFQ